MTSKALENQVVSPRIVKTCPCCRAEHDEPSWANLKCLGIQEVEPSDTEPAETHEMRNCACGSTMNRRIK